MGWFDVVRDTEAIAHWQRENAADARPARELYLGVATRRLASERVGRWVALPLVSTVALVGANIPGAKVPASPAADNVVAAQLAPGSIDGGMLLRVDDHERWAGNAADRAAIRRLVVIAAPAAMAAAATPVDPRVAAAEAAALLAVHGPAGAIGSDGIPVTVLAAYMKAEANIAADSPSCHLPWWLLAGIGRIESGHASGGRVDAAGTTRGVILGVRLDGSLPGTSVIRDTDHGVLDGDPLFDRAVGPMQFLPGTWARWGRDGNGDGTKDPNNVFDAATAAGAYLCAGGRDLATPAGISAAVLSYNNSQPYLQSVVSWGAAYRDGVTPTLDSTGSVPPPTTTTTTTTPPASAPPSPSTPPGTTTPSPTRPTTSTTTTKPPTTTSTTSTTTSATTTATTTTTTGTSGS